MKLILSTRVTNHSGTTLCGEMSPCFPTTDGPLNPGSTYMDSGRRHALWGRRWDAVLFILAVALESEHLKEKKIKLAPVLYKMHSYLRKKKIFFLVKNFCFPSCAVWKWICVPEGCSGLWNLMHFITSKYKHFQGKHRARDMQEHMFPVLAMSKQYPSPENNC